jgi:beta-glucosidase
VSGKSVPVVTLLYSGRPVGANDLINRSDAFIAAWLPGTEGMGLADMLLAAGNGHPAFDFTGRLPFDWPAGDCLPRDRRAQFKRGYGLSVSVKSRLGRLPEPAPVMACPAESR